MSGPGSFLFGEWVSELALTPERIWEILNQARARVGRVRSIPAESLPTALDVLRRSWEKGGTSREAFLESRPARSVGLSPAMIERGIDHFARLLHPAAASSRAASQLGHPAANGLRAEPLGVVLHVVSGNVFFGPAESLLAGLLTRNVNLVKRPRGCGDFLEFFFRSFQEAAGDLASCTALLDWSGGNEDIEGILGREADGIVIAGDAETIASYRRQASSSTALLEFGPRVSIAVVGEAALDRLDVEGLARDVALWDQLACTAAQCIYVQGEVAAIQVAKRLAAALADLARTLPEGEAGLDERIEVGRFRDVARFTEAMGAARVFPGPSGSLSTVVFEKDPSFLPSPLRRSVRVKSFNGIGDLAPALRPARGILQTVGLAVAAEDRVGYEECLAGLGARRFCAIGTMNEPPPDALHDGTMELGRLVRWVERVREG